MSFHDPLAFLDEGNYGVYNRTLAIKFGLNAAVLLSELVGKRRYHQNELIHHPSHGPGWFYFTIDHLYERIGLSRKEQETAIKILCDNGLVEIKVFSLPAKRHFRLIDDKILELFSLSKSNSSLSKSYKLASPKVTNRSVQKGQTPHIYNEPKEEPNKEYCLEQKKEVQKDSSHTISSKSVQAKKSDFYFCHETNQYIGITKEDIAEWKKLYPSIDVEREILNSANWVRSEPTKGRKKLWRKFLTTTWFQNAENKVFNHKAKSFVNGVDRRTKNADGSPAEVDYGW